MTDRLRYEPLSDACGAKVDDFDLNDISHFEFGTMRRLLAEYGVILIDNQSLTPAQHIAFARRWGDIVINRYFPADAAHPEIAEVRKEEDQKQNIGGSWHTDHSYDAIPAMGSILVARVVPAIGGDTLFSSMYAAYDRLPARMKETLETLRAIHSADHVFGNKAKRVGTGPRPMFQDRDEHATATHPVVITDPESGRRALYVNPAFTRAIEGWSREDSEALLSQLYDHASRQELTCRVKWRPGSVAIWDNRSTWHLAMNDYQGERRLMHRITVAGKPFG